MLSKTLQEGLKQYRIGEKLRGLRLRKKMGLVELGRHTDLSPALLSKLECGKIYPTLPTLLRVALVFGVGLDYFFSDETKRHKFAVVRGEERIRFPEDPGRKASAYSFESLDFHAVERKFDTYLVEFHATESRKGGAHQHDGSEFLYVIRGQLELEIAEESHLLRADDSIYFDSSVSHSYRKVGAKPCAAIVVVAP